MRFSSKQSMDAPIDTLTNKTIAMLPHAYIVLNVHIVSCLQTMSCIQRLDLRVCVPLVGTSNHTSSCAILVDFVSMVSTS